MRRLTRIRIALLGLALSAGFTAGCEDQSYKDIGAEISILVKRSQDALAQPARARLVKFGKRALPQIETALHTAPERGRLHLVAALEAIGEAEATPILRHFAVYDSSDEVRSACESVLNGWAAARGDRAGQARAALTRVAELKARGEAPTPIQ